MPLNLVLTFINLGVIIFDVITAQAVSLARLEDLAMTSVLAVPAISPEQRMAHAARDKGWSEEDTAKAMELFGQLMHGTTSGNFTQTSEDVAKVALRVFRRVNTAQGGGLPGESHPRFAGAPVKTGGKNKNTKTTAKAPAKATKPAPAPKPAAAPAASPVVAATTPEPPERKSLFGWRKG